MFKPTDKKVIENTRKSREWEKAHPGQNWRTNLTPDQIKKIEEERKKTG
jgi:hypothetical protein